jgi:hypothetical protein
MCSRIGLLFVPHFKIPNIITFVHRYGIAILLPTGTTSTTSATDTTGTTGATRTANTTGTTSTSILVV